MEFTGGKQTFVGRGLIISVLAALVIYNPFTYVDCKAEVHTEAEEAYNRGDDEHGDEEIVQLSQAELEEFGIELAAAEAGKLQVHIDLTGEIVIDPDRLAHITPRFPGIVKAVRKKIGDKVNKDEVLAIIESNESLAPYEVKSLIKGTVIDMHLTMGEVITDDSHSFTVADLSKVWVNLNVYQKDLPYISIGQRAVVSASPGLQKAEGKIFYISPVVDEETRTATARVVLNNPEGRWRPGIFVNARVEIENIDVPILVPKTALQTFEGQTVVFVKTDEGFRPKNVSIGRTNTEFAEIITGLRPGQEYVAKGGFTIKAELGKSSFGGHLH